MTAALRRRVYKDREVGELARDVSDVLARLVQFALLTIVDVYAEPMHVTFRDFRVAAVLAIDVRNDAAPDESVVGFAPVNHTPTSNGFRINAIEGPTEGTKYRITLLVIGGPAIMEARA